MKVSGLFQYSTTSAETGFKTFPLCPSEYKTGTMQIVTNSTRTVGKGAYLNKELLATKKKFDFTWYYMVAAQYAIVEDLFFNQNFFWIRIVDPKYPTSGLTVYHVYGGDLSADAVRADEDNNGQIIAWKNITWNLIER